MHRRKFLQMFAGGVALTAIAPSLPTDAVAVATEPEALDTEPVEPLVYAPVSPGASVVATLACDSAFTERYVRRR